MRLIEPRREVLRPEGYQEEHRSRFGRLDASVDRLQRGRIDPVDILNQDEQWFCMSEAENLPSFGENRLRLN